MLDNRIFIAILLSLEKRRNAQRTRSGTQPFRQTLCLIALPCTAVLSRRACVISTFVTDKKLRLKLFVGLCLANHWYGTRVAFCNLCKRPELCSSKLNIFPFVPAQRWVLQRLYEMPRPSQKSISGNASSRETAMFWQVSIACIKKKAHRESGGRSSMFWERNPLRMTLTELGLRSKCQIGLAKNVHCYLTKIGFAFLRQIWLQLVVTGVRFAILSLKKWPLPNQSNHLLLFKTTKHMQIWAVEKQLLRKWVKYKLFKFFKNFAQFLRSLVRLRLPERGCIEHGD